MLQNVHAVQWFTRYISFYRHVSICHCRPAPQSLSVKLLSETERICKFIDFFLKPLSNYHPSYIKDTYHFVAKIRGQKIPEGAFLVTGDVTALYTNMDIDLTLTIIGGIRICPR